MKLQPDADQRALIADAFSRPLDELLPLARLHKADAEEPWSALAELGIFGIAADEALGGVGLSAVEEALLAAELGRHLAAPRILATLAACHLADDETRARIVEGACPVAPAVVTGGTLCLFDTDGAELLLLRDGARASLIPADAVADRRTLDEEHWTARLEGGRADLSAIAWAEGGAVLRVRLLEAAALYGMAKLACDMAVDYAGFRQQFGHPIGGFQAVKHHCANMAAAAMAAGDQTSFASVALDQGRPDAAFQVESALLLAIDAALGNARRNVQVHGGIGFSEEADPHLVVKRAHLLVEAAGGADRAVARVAAADAPLRR